MFLGSLLIVATSYEYHSKVSDTDIHGGHTQIRIDVCAAYESHEYARQTRRYSERTESS